METFQKVLKKARDEGHIDPRILTGDSGTYDKSYPSGRQLQIPPQLLVLPEVVISDLQKITENIHQVAVSNSIQIIGFVGIIPEQGTSTVASLLSLLMAAREKMIFREHFSNSPNMARNSLQLGLLLIDAQLRSPSLHKKFGLERKGGLVDIFENNIPSNMALKNVPHSPLRIVPAGANPDYQLSRHDLDRLSALLKKAKRRIQFIFIDIPPLLTFSEGISLSRLCDGVILVIKAGDIRWEVIQEGKRLLERSGVKILGGILNRREFLIPDWAYKSL